LPIPDTSGVPPFADFEALKNKMNELVNKYNNLLVNLDSLNVVSLTADHITAGTIDASVVTIRSDLTAGAYVKIDGEGMKINDGTKDTFKADINGHVTMTGALVQSAAGYPKLVMDPENELFGAYKSETEFIKMEPFNVGNTSPQLSFVGGSSGLYMTQTGLNTLMQTINSKLNIISDGDVDFVLDDQFDSIRMDFVQLMDKSTNKTLYQQLLGKAKVEDTGYSLAFDDATRNLKLHNRSGSIISQVNIPR